MRLIAFSTLLFPFALVAQTMVGTSPENRTALMEEFTAVNCGNCPAGHVIAESLQSTHGNNLVVVGINAGGLAVPGAGQPDLRTTEGTALLNHFGVNATPKAVIGRNAYMGNTTLSSGAWGAAVSAVVQGSSPVNIGFSSTFDPGPRLLTVNVELYYTDNSPGGSDYITVLLKEDHIVAYQSDYGPNGPQANYDHLNVLRAYLTPLWGDEVTTPTQGTLVTRTYTYTVPANFDIANCSTVAFVGEYQGTVYQAREVMADGGITTAIEAMTANPIGIPFPVPASDLLNIPLQMDQGGVVELLDLTGKVLAQQRTLAGQEVTQFNLSSIASGTYLVQLAGAQRSRLVVVQH
ncbi:MAG: Omp28-related outer membrane protein [Flavobacteriales bacterium]|nr:Omp28-related outer membrane protein [Flavobacteriales bacterium]